MANKDFQSPNRQQSPRTAAEPAAFATSPSPQFYRNISASTLTLDSGKLFAPSTVEGLTDAEIKRFQNAEKAAGAKYVHPVPAPVIQEVTNASAKQ